MSKLIKVYKKEATGFGLYTCTNIIRPNSEYK